jgi:hypothetical protein
MENGTFNCSIAAAHAAPLASRWQGASGETAGASRPWTAFVSFCHSAAVGQHGWLDWQ